MRYLIALLLLAGCASQIMQSYVGKDIREAILDYGNPSQAIDMPDGTKAFQWRMSETVVQPGVGFNFGSGSATTTFAGNSAFTNASANTMLVSTPTVASENTCFYTLYAKRRGKSWVVTGFRQPRLACE